MALSASQADASSADEEDRSSASHESAQEKEQGVSMW
jgi:hypothetical protein